MDEVKETASPEAPASTTSDPPQLELPQAEEVAPARGTPEQKPTSDDWDKVRALALRQLNRFMSLEPKVLRGDDPDAIHDIRVASRRLQQVLDLLFPAPRPREIRRLRRRIRRCRRALGEVRNCDVLIDRVEKFLGRKRTAHRDTWTTVQHYLRERRSASFRKALRKLSKVNLAVFYVRLRTCLASDGLAPEPPHPHAPMAQAERSAPENFPGRVAQALERVWNGFESQIALAHRDPRAPVVHGVRIAAKRMRYLIEVIHAFEVSGSAEALAWLRKLQQHLGDWHDLEVLEQMMIEMVARPEFLRDHLDLAMGVEKLILRNRILKKGFEEKYFEMTRDSAGFERNKNWVSYLLDSPSTAFTKA